MAEEASSLDNEPGNSASVAGNKAQVERGSSKKFDYQIKIILVGKAGVGKTSLLQRFAKDQFSLNEVTTLGFSHEFKYITVKNKDIKITLWDTAGQERFRSIASNFYRDAQGVVIVYDVTDSSTFEDINFWENDFSKYGPKGSEDFVKILIGNKCDLADERAISTEKGKERAAKSGMSYYETSAKENEFVEIAFMELVTKILENKSIIKSIERKQKNLKMRRRILKQPFKNKCC